MSQFWSKTWDSSQGYPASHSWGENVIHLYQTFGPELTSNIPSLYPSPVVKGKEDLVSIGVNAVKLEVLHQASVNDAFYLLNLNHSKLHDTISLLYLFFNSRCRFRSHYGKLLWELHPSQGHSVSSWCATSLNPLRTCCSSGRVLGPDHILPSPKNI